MAHARLPTRPSIEAIRANSQQIRALSASTPSKDYAALQNKWAPPAHRKTSCDARLSPALALVSAAIARRMRDQTSRLGGSNAGTESFDRGNSPDLEG
jgi:hypothetical protein